MTDLVKNGEVKRGQIGIRTQDLTPDIASSLGLEKSDGALIAQVVANSAADEAGLQAGDLIVGVDGQPVHNVADFHRRVDFAHVGDTLRLSVLREGKPETVKVTIEKTRPSQRQSRQWN
jgi:S1-C subfamily serine protease